MVTVQIGPDQRSIGDVTSAWVNEQINRRRHENRPVCVQVRVQEGSLHMVLSTPGCQCNGSATRPPSEDERQILLLWERRGLDQPDFTGGNLIAFLQQLSRRF